MVLQRKLLKKIDEFKLQNYNNVTYVKQIFVYEDKTFYFCSNKTVITNSICFTMNKEKEALLKAILAEPDVPKKISHKNLVRFVDQMQPETQEMRNYLMAFFSSETSAQASAVKEKWYAKMTDDEQRLFSEAYYRCIKRELDSGKSTSVRSKADALAPSV